MKLTACSGLKSNNLSKYTNMNKAHKPTQTTETAIAVKPVLAEVLDSALATQWRVLVGSKLRIKKRLKTKTHVYVFGMVTTIPNEHLNFC